jgi:hypothetical protein
MMLFYSFQVAVLRRRPLLALKALCVSLSFVPRFLRNRAPISRADYRRWRATRASTQREYLLRRGRWRWYHQYFPALG